MKIILSNGRVSVVRPAIKAPAPPPPTAHRPSACWPVWAEGVALLRSAEDVGVGDTIHRYAKKIGAPALISILGIRCKCVPRRERCNRLYPYSQLAPPV